MKVEQQGSVLIACLFLFDPEIMFSSSSISNQQEYIVTYVPLVLKKLRMNFGISKVSTKRNQFVNIKLSIYFLLLPLT